MQGISPEAQNLANILIAVGSVLGAASFIFGLIEFISSKFRKGQIDLIITDDVFFRITQEGESFFVNIIMVGQNKLVRIDAIDLVLTNSDDQRQVQFKVRRVGKQRETDSVFQEFSFYTMSVFDFLAPNISTTKVIHSIENENSSKISSELTNYESFLNEIKPDYQNFLLIADKVEKERKGQELLAQINAARQECLTKILQRIKVNDGKYRLKVTVTYRGVSTTKRIWILSRWKEQAYQTISKEKEIVIENSMDGINTQLNTLLGTYAENILGNANNELSWPTIIPSSLNNVD